MICVAEVSFHRWEASLEDSHHPKWLTDLAYYIRFDHALNPIGSSPFKNVQISNERLTMGSCNTTRSYFPSTYEHMLVIHPKCKWVLAMTTEKRETYTPLKAWCWHELSFQVQVCQSSDNHLSAQAHLLNAEFQHKELPSINGNIVFILEGISKNKRGLSLLRWFARTLGDLCFEGGPLWEACYQGNTSRSSVCIHT